MAGGGCSCRAGPAPGTSRGRPAWRLELLLKRPTYLEAGQRKRFGKTVKRPIGQVEPAPDPAGVPDFDLGTWRVRPSLSRMTRADRIVALDGPTLRCLLVLHEAPP